MKLIRSLVILLALAAVHLEAIAQEIGEQRTKSYGLDAALEECGADVRELENQEAPPGAVHHFEVVMPCTPDRGEVVYASGARYKYVEVEVGSKMCIVDGESEFCDPMQRVTFWRIYYYNLDLLATNPAQLGPPQCNIAVGNPINIAARNKYEEVTDISDHRGLLAFKRHYNSHFRAATSPGMGKGWSHSYSATLILGQESVSAGVQVRLSTGQTFNFQLSEGQWISRTPGSGRLSEDASSSTQRWIYHPVGGATHLFDAGGRLTALVVSGMRVNMQYLSGSDDKVSRVQDHTGRYIDLDYGEDGLLNGVSSSSGESAAYSYVDVYGIGMLTDVVYGDGRGYKYQYVSGRLTKISDRQDKILGQYSYTEHGVPSSTQNARLPGSFEVVYEGWPSQADPTTTVAIKKDGVRLNRIKLRNHGGLVLPTEYETTTCIEGEDERYIFYDEHGKKTRSVAFVGLETQYGYDSRDRLSSEMYKGSLGEEGGEFPFSKTRSSHFTWHDEFELPATKRITNVDGNDIDTHTWAYNDRGQVVAHTQIDPISSQSRVATTTYCEQSDVNNGTCPAVGLIASIDAARTDTNDITHFHYRMTDAVGCDSAPGNCQYRKGDLWKITDALGGVVETLRYDPAGRPRSVKSPEGVVTDYEYNARGWLTSVKVRGTNETSEDDDLITQIDYWPSGMVKQMSEPGGTVTEYGYDSLDRLNLIARAGNTIDFTLDQGGNRLAEHIRDQGQNLRRTRSRVYDNIDRLVTEVDADDNPTDFAYFGRDLVATITDANGLVTHHEYDELKRLTRLMQRFDGSIKANTYFTYDALGRLVHVNDPKGLNTNYAYNAFGDLLKLKSPDTGTTIYTYDSAGNRVSQTDARGVTTIYGYDALNRLTSIIYPDAGLNTGYAYDSASTACQPSETFAKGRLSSMTDGSGSTQYCYDRFGNLVRKVQATNGKIFTLRYAYTKTGQLSSVIYPDGAVADYVRDGQGRVTEIGIKPIGGTRQVLLNQAAHEPFGPVAGWVYGNGRSLQRVHDLNYRPKRIHDGSPGGLSHSFGFDAVGNLATLKDGSGAATLAQYGYDILNRLTETKDGPTGTPIETYTYDKTGNRTSLTHAGITTAYTYPSISHRLDKVGTVARSYDASGNTITIDGDARQFVYDASGRMSQAMQAGMVVMNYRYNGRGEQVRKWAGTTNRYTLFDESGRWLGDYDDNGVALQQAIWLDDLPVGLLQGASTSQKLHYVEPDHLGTPRVVIDPVSDEAVWKWELRGEAFGDTAPNQNPDGDGVDFMFDMRYPGQRYDSATGMNYNYFRDYDFSSGRYAQSDPVGLIGGLTTYGYVGGMPLNHHDKYGLFWGLVAEAACEFFSGVGGDWRMRRESEFRKISKRIRDSSEGLCNQIYLACANNKDPKCVPDAIEECVRGRGLAECEISRLEKDLGLKNDWPWWDLLGHLCNLKSVKTKPPKGAL